MIKHRLACHLVQASQAEMQQLQSWFSSAEQQHSWGGDNFYYPCSTAEFLSQLCRPNTNSYSLIAEQDGRLLGFGQICDRFGCHHLARLIIAPQARGLGLAKILLSELVIEAQTRESRAISLYVHRHNHIALNLYQQIGFTIQPQPEAESDRLYFMTLSQQQAENLLHNYLHSD